MRGGDDRDFTQENGSSICARIVRMILDHLQICACRCFKTCLTMLVKWFRHDRTRLLPARGRGQLWDNGVARSSHMSSAELLQQYKGFKFFSAAWRRTYWDGDVCHEPPFHATLVPSQMPLTNRLLPLEPCAVMLWTCLPALCVALSVTFHPGEVICGPDLCIELKA